MTPDPCKTGGHISGFLTLIKVWAALIIMTGVTIWVSRLDIGITHVLGSLAIASLKGALVIAFFMQMRYEGRLLRWLLFLALLTLAIFIGFTFFDISYR